MDERIGHRRADGHRRPCMPAIPAELLVRCQPFFYPSARQTKHDIDTRGPYVARSRINLRGERACTGEIPQPVSKAVRRGKFAF
ncbi:hypothetical protein EVAR_37452_1 [Eumeta japonica]|uniref:Uncharacterized protein n=1 Tax=Eumeta variegata TaxID=151549 RepID=A0A4C1X2F1_EUMVA|nr:hypothetical protein EVAR_37452_1 [Eumeta japonica]